MNRWKFWLPVLVAVGLGALAGPMLRLALPYSPAAEISGLAFLVGMAVGALGVLGGALWVNWMPGD